MEQKEGGERGDHRLRNARACAATIGEKMAHICHWCGGWGTLALRSPPFQVWSLFAACFSIARSPHLAACVFTIRRLAQAAPEGHRAEIWRRRAHRSCLMRDTR
jgi:hypothetical protein